MKKALKIGVIGMVVYVATCFGLIAGYCNAWALLWDKKYYNASDELVDLARHTFKKLPKRFFESYMNGYRAKKQNKD